MLREHCSQALVLNPSPHRRVSAAFGDLTETWREEPISPQLGWQSSPSWERLKLAAYFFIRCSWFLILLLVCAHASHTSCMKPSQVTFSVLVLIGPFLHAQTHSFSTALCPLPFLPTVC